MKDTYFSLVLKTSKYFLAIFTLVSFIACSSQLSEDISTEQSDADKTPANIQNQENTLPPAFITKMLADVKNMPEHEQPRAITRYQYAGETVYLVTPPCCDFFSKLYDSKGKLLGSPDGGLTGRGDGSLPDFSSKRSNAYGIWKKGK